MHRILRHTNCQTQVENNADEFRLPRGSDIIVFVLVELVGPGGAGKSSVVDELQKLYSLCGTRLPLIRHHFVKARAAIEAMQMARRYRLRTAEALSLWRKCCSVESGLLLIGRVTAGVAIVDEGPIRTLRDTRCSTYRERAAWWSYGKGILERLADLNVPVLVVELRLDEETRRQRYRARGDLRARRDRGLQPLVRRQLNFVTRRGLARRIPSNRRAVETFIATRLAQFITVKRVDVLPDESPAQIAERINCLIAETAGASENVVRLCP